jgi:hypothetical protein
MSQKSILFLFFLLCAAPLAKAQTEAQTQYAAFYELGGNSFLGGVGVDRRVRYEDSKFSWAANATLNLGALLPPRYGNSYAPFSVAVSGLVGKTHSFEVGLGLRPRLHGVSKTYEAKEYSEGYISHYYQNISMDILPTIGYRVQPADGRFFGKFYFSPWGWGERADGKYGLLNWFPISEVQYSLAGLCLGFNLNKISESDDETERKTLQHSVLLDYAQGITYDLRINRPGNISFAASIGVGARTFGTQYSPHYGLEDWNLRGTALFSDAMLAKKTAVFEAGLQVSHGHISYYETVGGIGITKEQNAIFIGLPIGFRLQYPTRGLMARVYILPNFALSVNAIPNVTAGLGLGYSF